MELREKEAQLEERLRRVRELEEEVLRRERELKAREGAKKQVLLRLAPALWDRIAAMAADDFRSINGEIEYLLTQAANARRGPGDGASPAGGGER